MTRRSAMFAALRPYAPEMRFDPADVQTLDALADKWGLPRAEIEKPTTRALGNPGAFFAAARKSPFSGSMTEAQVKGCESILAACGAANWSTAWTANALGTAFLETNETMQPVREAYWLNDAWRKKNLRYYPHYGRGYVQLTHATNYAKADAALKLGGSLNADLDRALEPEIAAMIMVRGMSEGWFTGKKLADYLKREKGAPEEHREARRIINGVDRWNDLSRFAMAFQDALAAGEWA